MTFSTTIFRPGVLNGIFKFGALFVPELVQAAQSLFLNNEQGVWYDPSDFSTMFQDAAGTTPVTAVGQPVGRILDKSGRGNHASQATAASRPVLQQDVGGQYYLLFDGVDDWLQTASINFTETDKLNVFAGVRKLSDATTGIVCEFSADLNANAGTFYLLAPHSAGNPTSAFGSKGTANIIVSSAGFASPVTGVLTGIGHIGGPLGIHRRNGVQVASTTASQGTGNYGNYPLYIGRRGGTTLPFNGHLYGLVIRGALSTDTQINEVERYMGQKTGVVIPV